jgi:hypothetical protein
LEPAPVASGGRQLPEKRQSIRPDVSVLIGGLLVAVVLAAVWFAVTAAIEGCGRGLSRAA